MGVSTVGRILKIMKRTDKFLHSLYLKDDGKKIIFNENKNKKKKDFNSSRETCWTFDGVLKY